MKHYHLYKDIKDKTYSIFEIYHKTSLAKIYVDELNMKSVKLLRLIHIDPNIEIQELSNKLDLSLSNLSNHFNNLEKRGFLIRMKNVLDNRKTDFSLTVEGLKVIQKYDAYMSALSKYLKSQLSKIEGLTFIGFLAKINDHFFKSDSKTKVLKVIGDYGLLNSILDKVQDFFINSDIKSITFNNHEMTYDQLYLLSELYMNKQIYKKSNPQLADYLMISYQTLVTKTKKFISLDFIQKDENDKHYFNFPDEIIHILDNFIHTRIINYYEIMQHASEKEKEVIFKVFNLMKDYSILQINGKDGNKIQA